MDRRRFLRGSAAAGLLGLAGCTGSDGGTGSSGEDTTTTPATTASTPTGGEGSLPDGVYVQRFLETMAMQGTSRQGDYAVGLMYAVPHAFWNVTGSETQRTPKSGNVHLMAVVWDPETATVLPEAGVSVEVAKQGELVSQEVIYPMLSQRMGFHWGGNFGLAGDGEYVARVSIGGLNIRRTGPFAGRFGEPATVEVPFAFTEAQRSEISAEPIDEYGQRGALKPMEMGTMPQARAPAEDAIPGESLGRTTSDDAVFLTTVLSGSEADRFGAERYLAVSARTPYNRTVLPSMALSATVTRDGSTVVEGALERTLDPELGYHYGTALDGELQRGDELTIEVTTPPQVARHEGYERAFLRMDPMTLTV